MKTIAFLNQKGGTGKTTTTLNVGACLAKEGYKVLMIDTDPQGNLSLAAGFKSLTDEPTFTEVIEGSTSVNDAITRAEGGYDVIPTDGRQIRLNPQEPEQLREILQGLQYDYIVIDCAPSLSFINIMVLTASDYVVIPMQPQILPLRGLAQLHETIELVKEHSNPDLEIGGIIFTMYDGRRTLDKMIYESIEQAFPGKILGVGIGQNIALAESPINGKDIFQYAPKSKGAQQYEELTKELIKRM